MASFGLPDVLRQHAASRPNSIAAVCDGTRLTWRDIDVRAAALAAELRDAGVGRGDRVLWWGQNCHRLMEILFAVGQLGAVVCPANWRATPAEFTALLADCAPTVVVWQAQEIGVTADAVRAGGAGGNALWIPHDAPGPDSYEGRLGRRRHENPAAARPPDSAAAVLMLYTAAFDGVPCGALLSHRALLAQSMTLRLLEGLDAGTVYLNSGPMFHIGSLRRTIAVAHSGGRNVFCRRVDATRLCELIERERCTHAFLQNPTMVQMMQANSDGRFDLKSLLSSGGPPGWDQMVTLTETPRVASGYGQTEIAGVVTFRDPSNPGSGERPGPLARVEVHGPDEVSVAPGEIGEIVVRGPMVMNGYHNRPALNVERARGGWHHTHDLGRLESDGSITFVGPLQRIIKSAAENIYPTEVEAALLEHPVVREAAVLGVPDPHWGQRVKAVVVVGDNVTADDLEQFCRSRLAGYKCPRLIEFAEALPRCGTAVDRDRLDARYGGGGYPGSPSERRELSAT